MHALYITLTVDSDPLVHFFSFWQLHSQFEVTTAQGGCHMLWSRGREEEGGGRRRGEGGGGGREEEGRGGGGG